MTARKKRDIIVIPPGLIQKCAQEITSMTSVFDLDIHYEYYKIQLNVSSKVIDERLIQNHEFCNKDPKNAIALVLTS